MTTILRIENLMVSRGPGFSLHVAGLEVRQGEILALLGPNGAGKTTLLLAVAHLLEPERAEIVVEGDPKLWHRPDQLRRRIALVLQEPLLIDGTVWENVALGLRFRGLSREQVAQRVRPWLKRLGIEQIAQRRTHTLSGGEARRTSLARALVLEPSLLLLDEPFYALDPPTRTSLMDELRGILREAGVTTLMVTHDRSEALSLGDRIAIVLKGGIRQIGTPEEVFMGPVDSEVAEIVGTENILPGYITHVDDGISIVRVGQTDVETVAPAQPGERVFLLVRPEAITIWKEFPLLHRGTARNCVPASIHSLRWEGPYVKVNLKCPDFSLSALVTWQSAKALALAPGDQVTATFKASDTSLIRR